MVALLFTYVGYSLIFISFSLCLGSGTVYVSDTTTSGIYEVSSNGHASLPAFSLPRSSGTNYLTLGPDGALYTIFNSGISGVIDRTDITSGASTSYASGTNNPGRVFKPVAILFDTNAPGATGVMYTCGISSSSILAIPPSGGTNVATTYYTSAGPAQWLSCNGMALDSSGVMYVADHNGGFIWSIPSGGGSNIATKYLATAVYATSMAIDLLVGIIYFTTLSTGLYAIPAGGGSYSAVVLASDYSGIFNTPVQISVFGGNVFLSDSNNLINVYSPPCTVAAPTNGVFSGPPVNTECSAILPPGSTCTQGCNMGYTLSVSPSAASCTTSALGINAFTRQTCTSATSSGDPQFNGFNGKMRHYIIFSKPVLS
jgi:hypothetical protein